MSATALAGIEDRAGRREVAVAVAKAGSGSVASSLAIAGAVKIVAVLLGPEGVALLATLQQTRSAALVWATANGQAALVQGASARSGPGQRVYLRTAALIFLAGTAGTSAALVLFASPLAQRLAGSAGHAPLIAWLAIPVSLGAAMTFFTALLNIRREIGKMAIAQMAAALGMLAAAWPMAALAAKGSTIALAAILGCSAAAGLIAALCSLKPTKLAMAGAWWSNEALVSFARVAGAMLISGTLASWALLIARWAIVRNGGLAEAGFFDAAWAISTSAVTLLLASMQTYYLPALAAATGPQKSREIERMLEVITLPLAALLIALTALRPLLIEISYSPGFAPASDILRWTLIADYFKVTSWALGMPMLASADMRVFLMTETAVQSTFAGLTWLLAGQVAAAEAAGIGFLALYGLNLGLCWWYARTRAGFRAPLRWLGWWLAGLVLLIFASWDTWSLHSIDPRALAVWLAAAGLCAFIGIRRWGWFQ